MIEDGNYDEIKESVLDTFGWSAVALCLAACNVLKRIDVWVYSWTTMNGQRFSADAPRAVRRAAPRRAGVQRRAQYDVQHRVDFYLRRHPDAVYAEMMYALREYPIPNQRGDWSWREILRSPVPAQAPDGVRWEATLIFTCQHIWVPNDLPPGGERAGNGWYYLANPFPVDSYAKP